LIPIRDINPTVIRPFVTLALIALNVAIFFAVQPPANDPDAERFAYEYAAIPCELTSNDPLTSREINTGRCTPGTNTVPTDDGEVFPDKIIPLSVVSSMFLHGDLLHIAFNMWSLWIFGNNVEEAFGRAGYLAMYLAGGVLATLGYTALNQESTIPLVGASGAIAAVMGAYLILFPTHRILSLVVVFFVAVPAALFIGIWFIGQFSVDPSSNVAWEAHVAGFVFGVVIALVLRVPLLRRIEAYRRPRWATFP
jgi:membrane associated rhomboid family serine protease